MELFGLLTPTFGLVALGYVAVRGGWFAGAGLSGLSQFVFNLAVPALLLHTVVDRGVQLISAPALLLGYYGPALFLFGLGFAVDTMVGRNAEARAVTSMGVCYGNCALLGMPMVLQAYGESAIPPFFLLLTVHGPLLMMVATAAFESAAGARIDRRAMVRRTAVGMVQNPIVLALITGSIMAALHVSLPEPIDAILTLLGRSAVPCALFALGGSLTQHRRSASVGRALTLSAAKLVMLPLLVWLATGALGVSGLERRVATLTAAMPIGVNVFLFADRYHADVSGASTGVLLSTVLSVPTISLWLWLLEKCELGLAS